MINEIAVGVFTLDFNFADAFVWRGFQNVLKFAKAVAHAFSAFELLVFDPLW